MRVEEYVGRRLRARLADLNMTHQAFGEGMGTYLGKPWSRSTVSVALKGDRAWTAAELVAAGLVTHLSPGQLLTPPVGVDIIDFPGGKQVPRDELINALAPLGQAAGLDAAQATLQNIEALAAGTLEAASRLREVGTVLWNPTSADSIYPIQQRPVVAAIVTSELGVLVGRRNDGEPPWTFIAGKVSDGERLSDAAQREVKEEAGLLVEAGELIGERVHPRSGRPMIYIAAHPTHGTSVHVGDEAELAEVKWVSYDEAQDLMPDMFGPVSAYLARTIGSQERRP